MNMKSRSKEWWRAFYRMKANYPEKSFADIRKILDKWYSVKERQGVT